MQKINSVDGNGDCFHKLSLNCGTKCKSTIFSAPQKSHLRETSLLNSGAISNQSPQESGSVVRFSDRPESREVKPRRQHGDTVEIIDCGGLRLVPGAKPVLDRI